MDASVAARAVTTSASGAPADANQGSNVREAFRLMSTLIYPNIPITYLDRCARILQRRHIETVFEERAVQLLCAFPACGNKIRDKTAKYRVSLAKKEIYDAHTENQFCSQQCLKKAHVYASRLVAKPPQLVPSLMEVFGTDKPNPKKFEAEQAAAQTQRAASGGVSAAGPSSSGARRQTPKAKTVWAKNNDLGVVERLSNPVSDMAMRGQLAPAIRENTSPAAPEQTFPDAQQAVLIEGFVFPSHKERLAKKVETKWQDAEETKQSEIVVSDSDAESGDEYDDDDASSTSSVAMSDFEDEEEELISTDDLPLFINLWRIFSSWITHETTLIVANKPIPGDDKPAPRTPEEKKAREAADRAAQLLFHERYNAFGLTLSRALPQVSQQLKLSSFGHPAQRMDAVIKSFAFRDAIDGANSHLWVCIAALLLLVGHSKQTSTMSDEERRVLTKLTKLDTHELEQLLGLFYALRDESTIVVDEDVAAPAPDANKSKSASTEPAVKKCRKCRRPVTKCVCSERANASEKPKKDDFSTEELTQMFRDAVTLREQYEDLLEAAGASAYDDID
ncbi:hypothetical protein Poli38472_008318 [Pythium oligandrum]|uniref:RNA polymerase II subunit B1 CTD phosphatase RPAP2 homolog n=1 Tax=Pythium oligandrum TaxID=41045 RepID=A0A8K1CL75_PYTOL|nr:hypothetical protein Poli38472_008318 [Pythium oligandrum]|eukprot:TMW65676.1 hypothetical protein Poli38472_008318 [Pythium oligandrum]